MTEKVLGHRAYGSIPHLPSSRTGPSDSHIHPGQARIATEEARDNRDRIIVQEKLDGSCCAVAKPDGNVVALGRAGYPASTSPYEQHELFAHWVRERYTLFRALLNDGERLVGEWMAQAHGTIYDTDHPGWHPFMPFDLMVGHDRATVEELQERLDGTGLRLPSIIHTGGPLPLDEAKGRMEPSNHGADKTEGVVYRVERDDEVDFLCKWVRPDKEDGCYLPSQSGDDPIWLWRPT